MNATERAELLQQLHSRRDAIAGQWYRAIGQTSYVSLSGKEVRERLAELADQVIDLLLAKPFQPQRAQAIGAALAGLHYLQPEALGQTQAVLGQQIVEGLPADQVAALQPRLAALLGGLATGFLAETRDALLMAQEQIHHAVMVELRRVQASVEEERNFVSTVLDIAGALIIVVDGQGRIVRFNRACEKTTGYSFDEVKGRHYWELFVPAARREATQAFFQDRSRQAAQETSGRQATQTVWVTREGDLRLIAWSYTLLHNGDGELEYVVGVGIDVTERVQAEEALRESETRFRTMFESAPIGIAIVDAKGRLLQTNRAAQEMVGYTGDELQHMTFADLMHPDDVKKNRRAYRDVVAGKRRHGKLQARFYRADGSLGWCNAAVSAVHDPNGAFQYALAMVEDITEHKEAERRIIQAEKMISMGVMAGGIAHELRNPLSIASANAQLMLDHPCGTPLHHQSAHKIHLATQRASRIIQNLLEFARSEEDTMTALDVNDVLRATLPLVSHVVKSHHVTLQKELQPHLPKVRGNAGLLQQVFTNLIMNACNAMPEGGLLRVTGRAVDGGEVIVEFKDTGCGIPSQLLGKVFDPFYTTMPVGQGTGLGLSISYSIIQRHQGNIELESEVNKGTTVTVRLPALPDDGSEVGRSRVEVAGTAG